MDEEPPEPEPGAALGAAATLRRMESDATFRVRGPTTGTADLARLTHELLHSPCYHGKRVYHERRAEAETGLANRFALDLVPGQKGSLDPHNVPGNLAKWQQDILDAMYAYWSPSQNWEKRGVKNKWYPPTPPPYKKFADPKWGSLEVVWRTSKDEGAPIKLAEPIYPWAMNVAPPTNPNTSGTRLTKAQMDQIVLSHADIPEAVLDFMRDRLKRLSYRVAGFSGVMPLLNDAEIEAICGAVRKAGDGYVLAGWRERSREGLLFAPDDIDGTRSKQDMHGLSDDEKKAKRLLHADHWASRRKSRRVIDSWWDSLLFWVDEDGPLGSLLNGANGGTSGRPALLNTLTAVMDGTLKLPAPGAVLPTPPAPGTQPPPPTGPGGVVKLALTVNPYGAPIVKPTKPPEKFPVGDLSEGLDIVSRSRSRFHKHDRLLHIEIPGGYYVGQTKDRDPAVVDADEHPVLEDATVVPDGYGHAIYGYSDDSSKKPARNSSRFSQHRIDHAGAVWGVLPHGDLSLLCPGDEYTGRWKDGLRHDEGGQYGLGTSTMVYADGSKYVGMWSEGKPHGIGSFYSVSGWKYTGKFDDGFRVSKEIGTYFTPGERWARKGRRGFFPTNSEKFWLCEDWALKLADDDHSEAHRDALLTMDGKPEPPDTDPKNEKAGKEYHGGPVAAARRVVVEGVNYPTLQGNKFRDRVILRFASSSTLNAIKEAFKVTCPSDLGCGRDVTGYLASDWSRRYHQIKPIAVYTVDYTYHQRVSDAYRRCVFRVRDNRDRWLEVESRWYEANDERLAKQSADKVPKWISKKELGGITQASLSYGRFHVDPNPAYLVYPGPRTRKFPIFLASKTNPEGTGIRVGKGNDVVPASTAVSIMTPGMHENGGPDKVHYRPPESFAEAIGEDAELTSQVVTRTDTLFGAMGLKLLDPVNRAGDRIETVSSEPPLDLGVNEKLLFHGTASAFVERIVANGFDGFMAGAGIFGTVNYFAEDPGKADQYGRLSRTNKTGYFCGAQTAHYDLRLRERLGISDKDVDDAVVSMESGLDDKGAKDVFYMFVARVCLGTPMLVDEDAVVYENTAGNMGSWESMHVKEHFAMEQARAKALAATVVADTVHLLEQDGIAPYGQPMREAAERVMLRTAVNVLKRDPRKEAAEHAVKAMLEEWVDILGKTSSSMNPASKAQRCEDEIALKFLDDPFQGGEPRGTELHPWKGQPMPFWVQAMFRPPGQRQATKMTYKNTSDAVNKHVKHAEAPDIPASFQVRNEWRSLDTGNSLSLPLWQSKIDGMKQQKVLLEQQCKFNNAYDAAIGFGWGTRCGKESYRMRYREFCLARSDPNHPTEIAARPTHLVAYKRVETWPSHYPQNGFKPNGHGYMHDTPSNWGARWVKRHDTAWDKDVHSKTHLNGPITATESYPRIEGIDGGIAYV